MYSSDMKVCIVGGGPAGLASAIALQRESHEVTVVDCGAPPMDKACGEGLMPDGLQALRELGIAIPNEVGLPFRGVLFSDRRSSVAADFPNGAARGVRRTALHQLLVQRAVEAGVSLIWKANRVRLGEGGIALDSGRIEADLVVGADGQNSQIRRQAGLNQTTCEKRRYGFRRHYRVAPWSPYMELHWGPSAQIFVTPTAADEVCVAVLSSNPKLRLQAALRDVPELNERLSRVRPVSEEMGALSVSRRLRRVHSKNVVLVGDASGSIDAITGEGMSLAIKQARALAATLAGGGDLRNYQRLHRTLMKRPQTMASLMLGLEHNRQLRRRVLAGLEQHPELFESLLAIHVGASSFRKLCSPRLLQFGRAFLAA